MIFCDTSYLVRLYLEDHGWEAVRKLCAANNVAAAAHAEAELPAALHRAFRERRIGADDFGDIMDQLETDCASDAFCWQPLAPDTLAGIRRDYRALPAGLFLRAADALHLACARDHGFKTVYSNDKAFLAAAKHFGMRGRNVIRS